MYISLPNTTYRKYIWHIKPLLMGGNLCIQERTIKFIIRASSILGVVFMPEFHYPPLMTCHPSMLIASHILTKSLTWKPSSVILKPLKYKLTLYPRSWLFFTEYVVYCDNNDFSLLAFKYNIIQLYIICTSERVVV